MKAVMENTFAGELNNSEEDFLRDWPNDDRAQFIAEMIAIFFIQGISGKLRSLLGELERETECYFYEVFQKILSDGKNRPNFRP